MSKFDSFIEFFAEFKINFNSLKNEDLTESDTRSKLIDTLMKDGLGWSESNIRRESHGDSGYLDYIIKLDSFKFVVEAKKRFDKFQLPVKGRRHKLKSLMKQNADVINQIRGYLQDQGLTHGVITNGEQFIISRFVNTDGNDWKENEAMVFQSLEKLEDNIIEFYNILSFEAIQENGRIIIQPYKEFSKCLVDYIPNKKQEVYRNDFSSKLLLIIDRIFSEIGGNEDVEENRRMLEECYVPSIDIHKYSEELSGLFLDLPPTFDSNISKAKQTEHVAKGIKENLSSVTVPSPIVLIGGKGSGKTTFIRYFFNIVLNDKEAREVPAVYLDFRNYTSQQIEDTNAIYSKILDNLLINHSYLKLSDYKILQSIFKVQLDLKVKGIWSKLSENEIENRKIHLLEKLTEDPIQYLTSISNYLQKFQRRRICVIFDNADQLDNESQKQIFLLSQSLRGALGAIVFVSLREGYFYRWKNKPPFDAYHSNVYHISAPPYGTVLSKRIRYVLNRVEFEPITSFVDTKKVELHGLTLKQFFTNLYNTLFSSASNSEIMKYLEQTSYPNIRKGLEEMNNFLISGHTKIDSYITSQPNIPIWEFFKSIGLNNKLYYLHDFSTIFNIFYPVHQASDHFIKVRLLKFYYENAKITGFKENYLKVDDVVPSFLELSYSRDCIESEINSLLHNQLLISNTFSSDIENDELIDSEAELRISNVGIYYITELISRFHYLDLVLQDTPIKNEKYFKSIEENFPKSDSSGNRNLLKRLKTTEIFIEYLIDQESKEIMRFDSDVIDSTFMVGKSILERFLTLDKPRIENALYGKHSKS